MISKTLSSDVWNRLLQGKPLNDLPLGAKDGRVDLRGLDLPDPSVIRRFDFGGVAVRETRDAVVVKGSQWTNFDLSGSRLRSLRLVDCDLNNCLLDECDLQDLRIWSTRLSDCTCKGADLRSAALGAVRQSERNRYYCVDFSGADLRGSIYKAAAFEKCVFRGTKLEKIDFQTSTFSDCTFETDLRDVQFYRRAFDGEAFPPNEMLNVDFSRAKLHYVGFRGLTLEQVKLPEDTDHVVIQDALATFDSLIAKLNHQGDRTAKQLAAFLSIDRKWIPPKARRVVNLKDLAESVSGDAVDRLRELLRV